MLFLLKLLKLLEENFCELGVEDVEEEEEEDVEEGEFVSPLLLISMSFCSVWNGYLGVDIWVLVDWFSMVVLLMRCWGWASDIVQGTCIVFVNDFLRVSMKFNLFD